MLTHQLTRVEWDETFSQLGQRVVPDWIISAGGEKLWPFSNPKDLKVEFGPKTNDMEIVTPRLAAGDTGLFQLIPTLSYDSVEGNTSDEQQATVPQVVAGVNDRFRHIKSKWSTAFGEIEAGYLIVIKDIQELQAHLTSVKNTLGSTGKTISNQSVWEQLSLLSLQVAASTGEIHSFMRTTAENLDKVTTQCEDLHTSMQFLENETLINNSSTTDRLGNVEKQVAGCEGRLTRLLPLLQNLAKPVPPASSHDPLFREELQDLQKRMEQMSVQLAT